MNASHSPTSSSFPIALECAVLAHGAVQAPSDQIAPLRRHPGSVRGNALSPVLLRYADDQTVLGVAAVLQAIDRHSLADTDFTNWGILGSPTFLGRSTVVHAIVRFQSEGAWGVSPHIIPHRLLHAISGTVSQVLGVHGPNYGVGGGPGGVSEALLTALTLMSTENLPGTWLILTGHNPEPALNEQGHVVAAGTCQALAIALGKCQPNRHGMRLRITPGAGQTPDGAVEQITHESLRDALSAPMTAGTGVSWLIDGFGTLSLHRPHEETAPPDRHAVLESWAAAAVTAGGGSS